MITIQHRGYILAGNFKYLDELYAERDHWKDLAIRATSQRDAALFERDALLEKIAQVKAYDDKLDDRANGGINAVPPTGDDYNEVLSILGVHQ